MINASAKKRENIAEYLLYMWQIEDLIRANGLDMDRIRRNIIDSYAGLTPEQKAEMEGWYESLIDMMRREGKQEKGHLQLNVNTLNDLEHLHRLLLKNPKYAAYAAEFYDVLPLIVELRAKAGENRKDEIETCFEALYGLLMLRLSKKEVTDETRMAMTRISKFIARLAGYYKEYYNNELELEE